MPECDLPTPDHARPPVVPRPATPTTPASGHDSGDRPRPLAEPSPFTGPLDVAVVVRYRKAVTYGMHALLGALEAAPPAVAHAVRLGRTVEETAALITDALTAHAGRVLVPWSFDSLIEL